MSFNNLIIIIIYAALDDVIVRKKLIREDAEGLLASGALERLGVLNRKYQ